MIDCGHEKGACYCMEPENKDLVFKGPYTKLPYRLKKSATGWQVFRIDPDKEDLYTTKDTFPDAYRAMRNLDRSRGAVVTDAINRG